MTVADLIRALSVLPSDAEVVLMTDEAAIPFASEPWTCDHALHYPSRRIVALMPEEMWNRVHQAVNRQQN